MIQLARRHDGNTLTRLDEIAQREAVSANFLVQILNDLKRGGLIQSRRGKAGGYLLGQAPESISLLDIVQAVEPAMLSSPESGEGESSQAVRLTWEKVAESTRAQLGSISLRQLADPGAEPMYYI